MTLRKAFFAAARTSWGWRRPHHLADVLLDVAAQPAPQVVATVAARSATKRLRCRQPSEKLVGKRNARYLSMDWQGLAWCPGASALSVCGIFTGRFHKGWKMNHWSG